MLSATFFAASVQLHGLQFGNHCGGLLPGCFLALLGVDCFEHLRHIFDFGFGHNGEYVSVSYIINRIAGSNNSAHLTDYRI